MSGLWKRLCVVVIAAFMAASLLPCAPAATAAGGNPSYCDSSVDTLDNKKFGKDIPVVLVHGILGSKDDWSVKDDERQLSFYEMINSLPFVTVAQAFNYDADLGLVTADTLIPAAEKLAYTIECVGKLSKKSGGDGKVVVVGYSLGGLVSRLALNQVPTTKRAWKYVSQAITIGTPHKGLIDPLTQIYVDNLPKFPGDIDVVAVGGAVTKIEHRNNGNTKVTKAKGDGLVSVKSATTGYVKSGGGSHWTYTYECDQEFNQGQPPPTVGCQHGRLIQDPTNGLPQMVGNAMRSQLQPINTNTPPAVYTVGNLTLTMSQPWEDHDYGALGLGMDMYATDITNMAPCTNCEDADPVPMIPASVIVFYQEAGCLSGFAECMPNYLDVHGAAPNLKVGGKRPDYSAKFQMSGYPNKTWGYIWCFDKERVCVQYDRGVHDKTFKPSEALKQLIAEAKWAK